MTHFERRQQREAREQAERAEHAREQAEREERGREAADCEAVDLAREREDRLRAMSPRARVSWLRRERTCRAKNAPENKKLRDLIRATWRALGQGEPRAAPRHLADATRFVQGD